MTSKRVQQGRRLGQRRLPYKAIRWEWHGYVTVTEAKLRLLDHRTGKVITYDPAWFAEYDEPKAP